MSESVSDVCRRARAASLRLGAIDPAVRNQALARAAALLRERTVEILEANATDLAAAREQGVEAALLDRLTLDPERIEAIAAGVEAIVALPDPLAEIVQRKTLRSGIEMEQVRVPIGVIAIVYEARPNVTVDAAALCLKSGNAVVLRGSSSAAASNAILAAIVAEAALEAGMPVGVVELVAGGGREELAELARQKDLVDLIIPRGGEGLKRALEEVTEIPVLYAASGNCHVYVHTDADPEMAKAIAFNAKVQRPGVCNAAETLLVDSAIAAKFLPGALAELHGAGVELLGDERVRELAGDLEVGVAADQDWDTEYLGLTMTVGVVDGLAEAIEHINRHGSGHSEAIVTGSADAADAFTDGFEFGMGAEIGNSTQKLHARGPIGLLELTTTKYVLRGNGQVRS